MAWWLPLVQAGVESMQKQRQKAHARRQLEDDQRNEINMMRARELGASPYSLLGIKNDQQWADYDRAFDSRDSSIGKLLNDTFNADDDEDKKSVEEGGMGDGEGDLIGAQRGTPMVPPSAPTTYDSIRPGLDRGDSRSPFSNYASQNDLIDPWRRR